MAAGAIAHKAPPNQPPPQTLGKLGGFTGPLLISLVFHVTLVALLYFSKTLDALFLRAHLSNSQTISATLKFDELYKPTDTPMKKGLQKKDLPPPQVPLTPAKKAPPKQENPLFRKQAQQKELKKNIRSILDKIREEAKEEKRPIPKEDNFPMHEKGIKGARGTGGRGDRMPTPGEMAIQSAMRKYYEISNSETLRKKDPQARGFITLRLVGLDNKFQIAMLQLTQSSGYSILDQQCEVAIRSALQNESFAPDIIRERSGRDTIIICQP